MSISELNVPISLFKAKSANLPIKLINIFLMSTLGSNDVVHTLNNS